MLIQSIATAVPLSLLLLACSNNEAALSGQTAFSTTGTLDPSGPDSEATSESKLGAKAAPEPKVEPEARYNANSEAESGDFRLTPRATASPFSIGTISTLPIGSKGIQPLKTWRWTEVLKVWT